MLIVKKKRKIAIPKNLNIVRSWNIIKPIVAQEIGAPDYTLIPYCFDTNAYKIGHIFVPISTQVTNYDIIILDIYFTLFYFLSFLIKQIKCFRSIPVLKILGPIHNFAEKNGTSSRWLDKEFRSVRTASGDQMDFRVNINKVINWLKKIPNTQLNFSNFSWIFSCR